MSRQPQAAAPGGFNDLRIEIIIGTLLRTGVVLAAAVVLTGGVLYLIRNGHSTSNYAIFHGEPERLKGLGDIVRGALALDPREIIQLGLLLLIATPVARVAFSIGGFLAERDRLYTIVTLLVLAILLGSIFWSG